MNPLRFVHIPKTAGTTFARILEQQYVAEKKFLFTGSVAFDKEEFEKISEFRRDEIKLFLGHAPLKTGLEYVDEIPTVTFLRDPIERVKSFCQHVSEGKSSYLTKQFPPDNFDLDKFLNTRILELTNLHCKMLTNTGACASPIQLSDDDCLNEAKKNLIEKITAFGLLERFDESILFFKNKFNWKMPSYSKLNRKNENKLIEFKPCHIEKIKELNSLDINLYEFAAVEFDKRVGRAITPEQLKKFRKKISQQPQKNVIFNKLKNAFRF